MTKKPLQKKRPPKARIVGHRGQWTASVDGRELPILHTTSRVGQTGYFDPMAEVGADGEKHRRLTDALIANDVAVMQRTTTDGAFTRDGYVGLFSYGDLEIGDDGSIKLTLTGLVP